MTRDQFLAETLLELVPSDGSTIGNQSLFQKFSEAAVAGGQEASEADFEQLKQQFIGSGVLVRGKGRA